MNENDGKNTKKHLDHFFCCFSFFLGGGGGWGKTGRFWSNGSDTDMNVCCHLKVQQPPPHSPSPSPKQRRAAAEHGTQRNPEGMTQQRNKDICGLHSCALGTRGCVLIVRVKECAAEGGVDGPLARLQRGTKPAPQAEQRETVSYLCTRQWHGENKNLSLYIYRYITRGV